ncbi:MAG: hypothetical protein IJO48_02550 [Clostridia bacterium]|nr:hypothetical protein [Clostridia bacterium]
MKKSVILVFVLMLTLYIFTACEEYDGGGDVTVSPTAQTPLCTHEFETAEATGKPQIGYCGNTQVTVTIDGRDYLCYGSDAIYLMDTLKHLEYTNEICRCITEFTVTTEDGKKYGINLTEGFARCDDGQADLTEEQAKRIGEIVDGVSG